MMSNDNAKKRATRMFAQSSRFLCLVLGFSLAAIPAQANSDTRAYASFYPYGNSCDQSAATFSSCSVSVLVGPSSLTGASSATSTWTPDGSGVLSLATNTFGDNIATGAIAEFSDLLTVSGASGSGTIQVALPLMIQATERGDNNQVLFLTLYTRFGVYPEPESAIFSDSLRPDPGMSSLAISHSATIAFNVPTLFSVTFIDDNNGSSGFNGYTQYKALAAQISFPAFTVFDSGGNVLPDASVQFTPVPEPVPEPGTYLFVASGLLVLLLNRRLR